MVQNTFGLSEFGVIVTIHREEGSTVMAAPHSMLASDAADYFIQAQGYFRFAVQEIQCRSIEIELYFGNQKLEVVEISRD